MKNRIGVNPKTSQRKLTIKLLIRKMKKFIYAISAFAVIFAVGCSKDEVEKPAPEYDLVVNMEKPSFGDDTRAVRTDWENGDVVYINFNADISTAEKYLTLTYNAGTWTPNWVGTTAADIVAVGNGTLTAGYTNGAPISGYPMLRGSSGSNYLAVWTQNGCCVMGCEDGTYTVSGNTITLDITMVPKCAQVTVKGLNVGDNWVLRSDALIQGEGFSLNADSVSVPKGYRGDNAEGILDGFANADGVSFYGCSSSLSVKDITFYLTNGVKTYTRTFTSKTLTNGMAIIMNGPSTPGAWEEVTE